MSSNLIKSNKITKQTICVNTNDNSFSAYTFECNSVLTKFLMQFISISIWRVLGNIANVGVSSEFLRL